MTRFRRLLNRGAVCALALAAFVLPTTLSGQPAPLDGLADYVEAAMEAWDVPGVAIAVVKDGQTAWNEGFGVRDLGSGEPVDEHTLFAIGSASKAFTSLAVATLVDKNLVDWDAHATDFLAGFRTSDPYVTGELTIRDLMSHRSGLTRGDESWYAMDLSRDEVLERVRYQPPTTSFRSTFGYNNNMFLAAGAVIESVSGSSWDDFIDERFFTPLGMTRSATTIRDLASRENVAQPHAEIDDEVRVVPWRNIDNIAPAGSIISSVSEMSEWLKLQLAEGAYDGATVVSEAALLETHRPHTIIQLDTSWRLMAPGAHFLNYGMGWFLSDYRDRKVVAHGGNIDGMTAVVGMMPEEELGVVVLTNLNGNYLTYGVMTRIFDHYLGAPEGGMRDWSAELMDELAVLRAAGEAQQAEVEASRVEGTSPSAALDAYAGTYRHPMFGDIALSLEGGTLVASRGRQWTGDAEHWHHDTFKVVWRDRMMGDSYLTIHLDLMATPGAISIQGMAGRFERVPDGEGAP